MSLYNENDEVPEPPALPPNPWESPEYLAQIKKAERDEIALRFAVAIAANADHGAAFHGDDCAKAAFEYADAYLAARDGGAR